MDVVAIALHHAIAQGGSVLVGLEQAAAKLRGRNDARERGMTWAEAKALEAGQ